MIGAVQVGDNDEIMLITNGGTLVRTRAEEISTVGRNTQGVTLIQLSNGEKLVGLQRIEEIVKIDTATGATEMQPETTEPETTDPEVPAEDSDL